MNRRSAFAILAISAALCCFSVTTSAQDLSVVRVAINGLISDAPLYIAAKKGFFAKQGIKVEFVRIDAGTQMVAPLSSGQVDVAGGAVGVSLFNAVARGMNIKIVADRATTHPKFSYISILVRKDLVDSGKVKTYADLKGLRIAENGKGGVQASTVNEALKRGGATYDDVEHIYSLSNPDHVAALSNKAIDASLTTEPLVTLAIKRGVAVAFSGPDLYPNQVIAALVYGGHFIAQRPDIARKFMVGYIEGVRYFNGALVDGKFTGPHAADVIDILIADTSIKDRAMYSEMIPNWVNPDGRVNEDSLRKDLAFFRSRLDFGLAENASIEAAIDHSFVDHAIKILGPASNPTK